ncbi:MAG: glycerate kinase [DPANN group archaeon]|nr:glycerate kinase [DPANN group archaeon]
MELRHILIAPNAFKETFSAGEIGQLMASSVRNVLPETTCMISPIADGGDSTIEAVHQGADGELIPCKVIGPYRKVIASHFLRLDATSGLVEMALSSGLALTEENERNLREATSYGLGQLIKAAIDLGLERIYVGVGGSATNDCGIGMAQALGVRFLDDDGKDIMPPDGGFLAAEDLPRVRSIDTTTSDRLLEGRKIIIASDVDNPLLGQNGATAIYGPQKGGDEETLHRLERWLEHCATIVERHCQEEYRNVPGAGAAGGVGFGLLALCHATVEPGFGVVAKLIHLQEKIGQADLILTGEGRIDGQSAMGKAIAGLGKSAGGKPVIAIAGTIGEGYERLFEKGISCIGYLHHPDTPFDPARVKEETPALLERLLSQLLSISKKDGIAPLKGKTVFVGDRQ